MAPEKAIEGGLDGIALGKILAKLESIEKGVEKLEEYDKRIQAIEKDQIEIKGELKLLNERIGNQSNTLSEKTQKTPWWTIVAGIASITSILLAMLVIIPLLSQTK